MSPDRVVVGAFDDADGDRVVELFRGVETQIVRTDVPSAELVKLAANAFLSTRISFINEIANVCELVGADVVDVARGVGLDHRLGSYFLRAGIGFGGSCFPKDVTALKQLAGNSGYQFMLLHAVWEVNELQKRRVVQKLQKHLGPLRGKTIALLGLAFKPNTDDMREAPSRVIAYRLLSEGAEVRAWDPIAHPDDLQGIELSDSVLDAVRERRRGGDRHGVARARGARNARGSRRDGASVDHRRPQPARPRGDASGRLRLRGHRPPSPRVACGTRPRAGSGAPALMEALLLAGGKAERLGEAAQGLPKPLVPVAGFPLAEYTVGRLVAAGVDARDRRVPGGAGAGVRNTLGGFGAEIDGGRRAGAARPRRRPSPRGVASAATTAPYSR